MRDIYAMYIYILIKQPFMLEGHRQEEYHLFVYILIKTTVYTMYYVYILCIHTMYIYI